MGMPYGKRYPPRADLTGRRVGRFLVLADAGTKRDSAGHTERYWRVRCDCGYEREVTAPNMRRMAVASCGCVQPSGAAHPLWRGTGGMSGEYWNQIRGNASKRGLVVDVTAVQAWSLFEEQRRRCALSGLHLSMASPRSRQATASLDRIDSSLGYVTGNVQWVHKDMNRMKGALSDARFVELCTAVALHQASLARTP